MLINTTNGSLYFTIFYSLAFFVTFLMLLREGYLRKIPLLSWVLLLIFSRIFFIIGTKIFTFDSGDWLQMLQQTTLFPTSDKILPGGIFLGIIALVTGKFILRIKENILDAFAVIVPIGFGIQKIGCSLNGCCFGKPTTLPWGIQYGVNSAAHYQQLNSGLISTNELLTLDIHPVQLYEITGALLVAFIVFKSRKLWKANGSLFIFSLLCFGFFRFLTEFFRDISAHTTGGTMIGIFNQIQWIMFLVIVIFSFVLLYREKKIGLQYRAVSQSETIGIPIYLFVFAFEALLIWALRNWLSQSELISIFMTFFISGMIIFAFILNQIISSKVKMIYAGLLILPLLLTSQTVPQTQRDSTLVIRTKKISSGLTSGNFENSFSRLSGTTSEGCNTYEQHKIKQKYTLGGVGYSIRDELPEKKYAVNYGMNIYLGQTSEIPDITGIETKTILFGLNPFVKFETNWLGIGGGIHGGNFAFNKEIIKDYGDATKAIIKTTLYPQAYLRIGPQRILYAEYHLADQFPAPFPYLNQQIGIGTGLGTNYANFRVGAILLPASGAYWSAYFPVSKSISLEPLIVISQGKVEHFSFGLHYMLSSKSFYRKNRQN